MTMQLFSFGHPCEHQLRRTCIGGSSCPLHGYPDAWCCSYVKGKINFKRDKPCEGPRCRWGFTHPTQAQFDAVTQVIGEGKAIAVKLDESGPNDLLTFQIDSPHVIDTVQCALHVMKHPPSSCGKKIGQLLAFAAVRSSEAKVFTQLLKTMKKPIDNYLLGAYDFLMNMKASRTTKTPQSKSAAAPAVGKEESMLEDLRSDIVDVMSAALSQNGQLVVRDDQVQLQQVFVAALKSFPKSKKKQEMLEAASTKFKLSAPAAVAASVSAIETPELPPAVPPKTSESKPATVKVILPVDESPSTAPQPSARQPPAPSPPPAIPLAQPRKVVGISRCCPPSVPAQRKYTPLAQVACNVPEGLVAGGLFAVMESFASKTALGHISSHSQSCKVSTSEESPLKLLAEGVAVAAASQDTFSSIFGTDPLVSHAPAFGQADKSLLEGVLHAWGQ